MSRTLSNFALVAGLALALSFTFSCSSDDPEEEHGNGNAWAQSSSSIPSSSSVASSSSEYKLSSSSIASSSSSLKQSSSSIASSSSSIKQSSSSNERSSSSIGQSSSSSEYYWPTSSSSEYVPQQSSSSSWEYIPPSSSSEAGQGGDGGWKLVSNNVRVIDSNTKEYLMTTSAYSKNGKVPMSNADTLKFTSPEDYRGETPIYGNIRSSLCGPIADSGPMAVVIKSPPPTQNLQIVQIKLEPNDPACLDK